MSLRNCLLACCLILFSACGGNKTHSGSNAATGNQSEEQQPDDPAGNWYKRLSGTLAGKPIVVHLQRYDGRVKGFYEYTGIGQLIQLFELSDSSENPGHLRFTELVPQEVNDDAAVNSAIWDITMNGSSWTGDWKKGDSRYELALAEDYPEGSTRLRAFYMSDSAGLFPGKVAPGATISYGYLLPADDRDTFTVNAIRSRMWPDSKPGTPFEALIRSATTAYFAGYRSDNAGEPEPEAGEEFSLQYSDDNEMHVLYNDAGWLVMENFNNNYTGGAHGNYGSTFWNIDTREKRVWEISDVLTDTTGLRPYLAQAAIEYFRLKPGDRIDDHLLVAAIPPTSAFFLSNTGITFTYSPYEIASYAEGQIRLFIPYQRLQSLLTPAFRDRMGIAGKTGVAFND